jgi:hypothetical protein
MTVIVYVPAVASVSGPRSVQMPVAGTIVVAPGPASFHCMFEHSAPVGARLSKKTFLPAVAVNV